LIFAVLLIDATMNNQVLPPAALQPEVVLPVELPPAVVLSIAVLPIAVVPPAVIDFYPAGDFTETFSQRGSPMVAYGGHLYTIKSSDEILPFEEGKTAAELDMHPLNGNLIALNYSIIEYHY
jgi:hypothetical protein